MGKRKKTDKDADKEEDDEYIRKKIRKYERKLKDKTRTQHQPAPPPTPQPTPPPPTPPPRPPPLRPPLPPRVQSPAPQRVQPMSPASHTSTRSSPPSSPPPIEQLPPDEDEDLPEEFLLALGTEGEEKVVVGDPLRPELASRWTRIMYEGLEKDAKEAIIKKYPTPANFPPAIAPIMNDEMLVTLAEPSVKRDNRIIGRQNLTGVLMTCLGKSLTNVLKGNINSKNLIEEINDAAKLAAEIHYQDSSSRRFFGMAGANKTVQEALRRTKIDKYLFGKDCGEKIKAAQTIQKNSSTIKSSDKDKKTAKAPQPVKKLKNLNWKGPPQFQQHHRARGGQQSQPKRHYNQPHRKERQHNYKSRSRYRR